MSMFFFTYRAGTQARMGAEILRQAGISARLEQTPARLAKKGCGYGLWVSAEQGREAARALKGTGYTGVYRQERGTFREVRL